MEIALNVLYLALIVAVFGYAISVLKEKMDLMSNKVQIRSKVVTEELLEDIDMKHFQVGKIILGVGDEVIIYLHTKDRIRATVLGAMTRGNKLVVLTKKDKVEEIPLGIIAKLKIRSKYGRLF